MKKIFFSLLLFPLTMNAQKDSSAQFIHGHMFRSQATISPGYVMEGKYLNIYLHGTLEYYLDNSISLRGDGFYFLKSNSPGLKWKQYHSILAGASYHIKTKNRFDPYIALQPGVGITQLEYGYPSATISSSTDVPLGKVSATPLISGVVGFNYYFQKVFHLLAEARYVNGKHLSDISYPISLSEVKFSFGLGWNIK